MKILSFIFSFYILFLAILPGFKAGAEVLGLSVEACCADSCELEGSEDHEQSPGEDESGKGCNPFQFCKCCTGFNGNVAVSGLVPVSIGYKSFALNKEEDLPQVSIDFWQPPKIG